LNRIRLAAYIITALFFIIAAVLYPLMPETMASHWGLQGEANGTMPKLWALFLMPVIALGLLLLFELLPLIDPLKKNYAGFRKEYDLFVGAMLGFLLYLYALTLSWNAGFQFSMLQAMAPAFGALFWVAGMLLGKAKRNWFVGIRTPWTMSSQRVWEKTHRMAGKLFKAAGVIVALGVVLPDLLFPLMIAGIVIAAFVPVVYSYIEYNRAKRKAKK